MTQPRPYEDDGFDAGDEFLEDDFSTPSDPFLDAATVEARLRGEVGGADDGFDEPVQPAPQPSGPAGFGARLAAANKAAPEFISEADPAPAPGRARADARNHELSAVPAGLYGEVDTSSGDVIQPVPRISIEAFCERPETGALIHNAGADRRLARAHVNVELGGLAGAIERFHDESTPNLLIIETGMRGAQLFAQLDELASVCDSDTRIIIIGAANDIALYRELMRRGVSEYLVPPMTPLHLIRTISGLFVDPDAPFAGRSIAFIGAKGGVGSSTIAHNIAWCMGELQHMDTVLVDLDLSFGTAGLDFNQDPAQTIGHALADPDRLDDALLDRLLVKCGDRLSLFSAPATLESDWDFGPEAFEIVLEKVRRQAPYVALDLPHAWSPWVRRTLLSAEQVVVTVTPDLACLRNAKNLFDLVRQNRPNDEPPKVIVNMAGCPKKPDIPLKDFSDALGTAPILVLPFEPALFGSAANNGQMIAEVDAKSKAADGFAHVASQLTGRSSAPVRQQRSGLKSLFGRKG
ncbi:pilus assembly protein CpaE [Glycocaulis albus]|nr:AAA family ATPase [Glycocaulis albus]GGH07563.1 pilus assembly protein CpaE [Glycocaulis albus]